MEKLSSYLRYPVRLEGKFLTEKSHPNVVARHTNPMESHSAREILFIITGSYDFLLNGNCHLLEPGDCCFIDKWVPHQKQYIGNGQSMLHQWIYLHADHCNSVFLHIKEDGQLEYDAFITLSPALAPYLNGLWDLAKTLPPDGDKARQLYSAIASRALEETVFWDSLNENAGAAKLNVVAYIKNYINLTNGSGVTLEKLESLTGYNRFHLTRIFKNECKMTIHEYIDCVRRGFIQYAESQKMPQKEIAHALGFSSPTAFWLWKNRDQQKNS